MMNYQTINQISKYAKEYGHSKIRDAGVSDTEHKICTFLYFHNDVSQDMVAKALMLDKTTLAKALISLEERGLILRIQNPANRRENILNITKDGKATIADIVNIYRDNNVTLIDVDQMQIINDKRSKEKNQ
ncbi:MAG TPA: MarR family transcriptional regulator [Bacillota bacterium]|nr:MarR family transcriptional regulator [Bacillota bacterium]